MFVSYFESNQGMLVNAPFRSQIFKIFIASGCNGALTPNRSPADVPGPTLPTDRRLTGV